jgi:hypothetical protein
MLIAMPLLASEPVKVRGTGGAFCAETLEYALARHAKPEISTRRSRPGSQPIEPASPNGAAAASISKDRGQFSATAITSPN